MTPDGDSTSWWRTDVWSFVLSALMKPSEAGWAARCSLLLMNYLEPNTASSENEKNTGVRLRNLQHNSKRNEHDNNNNNTHTERT